ncbi:MAG: hypothetical protein AAFR87_09650 [Bacteroidota bacterium]
MGKKPHQKQSVIKKVFADFRKRLHPTRNPSPGIQYEVKKLKKGFRVIIHKERGADEVLNFENKKELDAFLSSVS